MLGWILGAAILDALLGFVGVFSLWFSKKDIGSITHILIAFAAGTLLGGAFFHLLPESMTEINFELSLLLALIGFIVFMILESYFHWHRCEDCKIHPFSYMIVVGDGIHNFLGGIIIAASFLASIPTGIATTLAILAHELPQQLGIFGVLIKGGFERNKAILYSFVAQSTVILGAIVGYFLATETEAFVPLLVPFAAGNFIYIAASDLVPEMHKSEGSRKIVSIFVFVLGLLFMYLIKG